MKSMKSRCLFMIVCALAVPCMLNAAGLSTSWQASVGEGAANRPMPIWSGGVLVTLDAHGTLAPHFVWYDKSANIVGQTTLSIPGAVYVLVRSYAHAPDGATVACGSATDAQGRTGTYVATLPGNGGPTNIVRTSPYSPQRIAITSDGSVWTVGYEPKAGARQSQPEPTANIVRRWDRNGNLTGSWLPQSSLADAFRTLAFDNAFAASPTGVVWYSSYTGTLTEVSLTGQVSQISAPLPGGSAFHLMGMTVTDSGKVVVAYKNISHWGVMVLDRTPNQWKEIQGGPKPGGLDFFIYGSDADNVVGRLGGRPGDFTAFSVN